MSKNLIIWDIDHISYFGSSIDTLPEILEKVDYKINEVLEETNADFFVFVLSQGKYFRHNLTKKESDKTYKGNRNYQSQPWVKTIKEYLKVKYGAVTSMGVEGDDLAALYMSINIKYGKFENPHSDSHWMLYEPREGSQQPDEVEEVNKILVATDKDLLKSIPGRHLNPVKKLDADTWGLQWIETSEEDSWFYEWEAMVCGDTADGISGLYRKGKAWCDKNFAGKSLREVQLLVFDEYCKEYGDVSTAIYEFQKNWRLLHILNTPEDFMREIGIVPELPTFLEVKREETTDINFD